MRLGLHHGPGTNGTKNRQRQRVSHSHAQRLFHPVEAPAVAFPIQSTHIDWDRLVTKRPTALGTVDAMPMYLLKPEVLRLLNTEKHPTFRLILDLMWNTGARSFEVLELKPTSFVNDGYDFGVILKTLKKRHGRPIKKALQPSPKRYIPITDHAWKIVSKVTSTRGTSKKPRGFIRCAGRR